MSTNPEQLTREGIEAFKRGDYMLARGAFAASVAARPNPQIFMYLAQACAKTGDSGGQLDALDRLLAAEPRNLHGLIARADLARESRDDRTATAFYNMALATAAQMENLPPGADAGLRRAEAAIAASADRFEDHLIASLAAANIDATSVNPRFAEALDISSGRKEVFLQQPTSFFYPGLPHRQFYDGADFAWVAALEAAAPAMRAEAKAVIATGVGLSPYVEADPGRPNKGHALLGNPDWSAFFLWKGGELEAENAARCPATAAALEAAPIPRIAGRSPMALFSVLKPKTHIPKHSGLLNTRLICHIPLIVPSGCRLRVGNETRTVEFGKAMIFDDSIEHEAWNDSDDTRLILLFEIWRPELDKGERVALTAMFEAIEGYGSA
jgi:aspartyl/asparaginyl beta-hydroxylase (cupin superfamily)